jgi:hypothetical protein
VQDISIFVKDNIGRREYQFLSFLYGLYKKSFFLEKTHEHVGCEDLHATFYSDFFLCVRLSALSSNVLT